ncbi:MAG: FAD-binding oxidoreductase, partial [Verrucomicrobiota bacterium]|nr:FAD-binding oxidoreductase [Verrucomicrobiota bacterium]
SGGRFRSGIHLESLEEIPRAFEVIVNCAGVGARDLVADAEVEPHRGQIALVAKGALEYAVVCNDLPLIYAFPRAGDCVFGGTNEISAEREPRPAETAAIVSECARVLQIAPPPVLGERVGLRPFRRAGVRLECESLGDGRPVIHNYGHGGSGFTLSWGCAEEAVEFAQP